MRAPARNQCRPGCRSRSASEIRGPGEQRRGAAPAGPTMAVSTQGYRGEFASNAVRSRAFEMTNRETCPSVNKGRKCFGALPRESRGQPAGAASEPTAALGVPARQQPPATVPCAPACGRHGIPGLLHPPHLRAPLHPCIPVSLPPCIPASFAPLYSRPAASPRSCLPANLHRGSPELHHPQGFAKPPYRPLPSRTKDAKTQGCRDAPPGRRP